jgi:hypothetical protein
MAMQVYEEQGANIRFELRKNKQMHGSSVPLLDKELNQEENIKSILSPHELPPPPPPPPPPMQNINDVPPLMPPPPPPPPSGGIFGSITARKQMSVVSTVKAAQKLKVSGLNNVSSNSIWSAADRDIIKETEELIPQTDFEKLFCISMEQAKAEQMKIERRNSIAMTVGPKVICLLDTKRSTNISISLSQLRSIEEIRDTFERIQKADTSLSEDLLTSLIKCEPSNEEINHIREFKGDKESLNIPEKFVLEFSQISEMSWMIRVLRYIQKIPHWASELDKGVTALRDTFWIIRHSQVILRLMMCLRRLYELNNVIYGPQRSVQGFSFEDVLEFSKVTSIHQPDSSTPISLIDYLDSKMPEICDQLTSSLSCIEMALTTEWDVLASDLTDLKVADRFFFQKCDGMSHSFCESVRPFFNEWHERIVKIDSEFTDCRSSWLDLCDYFQQNSEELKPNEFLHLWKELISQLGLAKQRRIDQLLDLKQL